MWIKKRGKLIFMCTNVGCDNTEHFQIELDKHFIVFVCIICQERYLIYEVDD